MSAVIKDEKVIPAVGIRMSKGKNGLLYGDLHCTDDELASKVAAIRLRFAYLQKEDKSLLAVEVNPRTGRWNDRLRTFEPATAGDPFKVIVTTTEWKGILL